MKDAKYIELAAKYLSGEISVEERKELMEWIAQSDANQAFFDQMIHLWSLTGDTERVFEADTQVAWQKVSARIDDRRERKTKSSATPAPKIFTLLIKRDFLRIAAVILPLLAVAAWWLLQPGPANERLMVAGLENTKEVLLPDGSQVTLNKNSSLSYLEAFKERKVTLVGEAFFDVAREERRPFEIYSDQTLIRVLGTSFNVRAYPDEDQVEVMVRSGKVEFRGQKDQQDSVILTENEAAVFKKIEQEVKKISSLGSNANAWMKKEIDANDIPLGELLKTINNYFRTEVMVENRAVLECKVTIPGLKDPSLDYVLMLVGEFMDLEIDSTGNTILLKGEGCINSN